jgi:DNA polymerase elongation subunit (family B)
MNGIKRKRLFFDIETSPNIGFFWSSGYKVNIPFENILKERAIICIAYKWEYEDNPHCLVWDRNQNDEKMLREFIEIANDADEIIGHNVNEFDLPWIRTKCIKHNIPCFPQYTTIDTLKQARSHFRFNSNKLDYIAQYLGLGEKISVGFDLWKKVVLSNDDDSLKEMTTYCMNDVVILEKVYQKLSQYVPHTTHYGVMNTGDKVSCPECGSFDLNPHRYRYSKTGMVRIQLKCANCGRHHTVSKTAYDNALKKRTQNKKN